jgi:hypothetical protein
MSALGKCFFNDLKCHFGLTVGITFVLQNAINGGCGARDVDVRASNYRS